MRGRKTGWSLGSAVECDDFLKAATTWTFFLDIKSCGKLCCLHSEGKGTACSGCSELEQIASMKEWKTLSLWPFCTDKNQLGYWSFPSSQFKGKIPVIVTHLSAGSPKVNSAVQLLNNCAAGLTRLLVGWGSIWTKQVRWLATIQTQSPYTKFSPDTNFKKWFNQFILW